LKKDHPITLVFIEANEMPCFAVKRDAPSHPLGRIIRVRESVSTNARLMDPIASSRTWSSIPRQFNVHELRHFITARFIDPDKRPMLVSVVSFGYRYVCRRTPTPFRVRFLPIPFCAPLAAVHRQGPESPSLYPLLSQTGEFLRRIEGLLTYLIPHYIREGKSYLTIAFWCTGGKHRSSCRGRRAEVHEEHGSFAKSFTATIEK